MPKPSTKTIKSLFALSGNFCAFPNCTANLVHENDTIAGHICHIISRRVKGPRYDASVPEEYLDSRDNLILLCAPHHKTIDDNPAGFPANALREMRALHEKLRGRKERSDDERCAKLLLREQNRIKVNNYSGNVAINSPNVIQAKSIHIRSARGTIRVNPPPGTIGADLDAAKHISYLIKRYNDFASKASERTKKFSFGAISKNIEDRFDARWALLPMANFNAVCEYLESRIDRTRTAKLNASRGHPSYSSFAARKRH